MSEIQIPSTGWLLFLLLTNILPMTREDSLFLLHQAIADKDHAQQVTFDDSAEMKFRINSELLTLT